MLLSMPARKLSSLPCPVGTKPTSLWQKSLRSACQRIPPLLATKPMIAPPSDRQRSLRELKPAFNCAILRKALPASSSGRKLLPKNQALPASRHSLRQTRRNFPGLRLSRHPAHLSPQIDDLQTRPRKQTPYKIPWRDTLSNLYPG